MCLLTLPHLQLLLLLLRILTHCINARPIEPYKHQHGGGYRPLEHTYTRYLVSIRTAKPTASFGDNHFCVGTIITMRLVLTAAHCVMDRYDFVKPPSQLVVVAGAPNRLRLDPQHTVQQQVESIMPHALFRNNGGHDIALLRLVAPFPDHNAAIQMAQLSKLRARAGQWCTVAGWGQLFHRGPYVANAIYIDLTVFNQTYCQQIYGAHFDAATLVCAGREHDWDASLCRGDSGAPLFCNGLVYGIVSWGSRCGEARKPTVFTSVQAHERWIAAYSSGEILDWSSWLVLPLCGVLAPI